MLQRLKSLLRRWLELDAPPVVSDQLEAYVVTKGVPTLARYRIIGARGMHLVGVPIENAQAVRLIGQHEAVDQTAWFTLWKQHTPDAKNWVWEDGRPFLSE